MPTASVLGVRLFLRPDPAGLSSTRVATSPDFKTTLLASIHRLGDVRMLGRREALLMGQTAGGSWTRLRIPARYAWFEGLLVQSFIKLQKVDRLAILIVDDYQNGRPRRLRLECVDRAQPRDETLEASLVAMPGNRMEPGLWAVSSEGAGDRLAKLARAARKEWSGARPGMRLVSGRPWPLTLLALVLAIELVAGLVRIRWVLAGSYSWLPIIPTAAAAVVFAIYVMLVGVTLATLWRQARLGYVLALVVAAVQFVRPIALVIPVAHLMTFDRMAWYLLFSWLLPIYIWLALGLLYWEKRSRAQSTTPSSDSPAT